jgi:hypothetical protein
MALITIDKLTAGMVLDTEVCDRTGRVLLKCGCELTDWHIGKLASSGVVEVDIAGIESSSEQADENISPEMMQQCIAVLDPAFSLVDKDWDVMKELHRLAVKKVVRKKMEEE